MCIIIDTNTVPSVFSRTNKKHKEFEPILDWLIEGKGKVIYGGSRYLNELGVNYLKLFGFLRTAGKAIYVSNEEVDSLEHVVSEKIKDRDFNDQHLVSLLLASGCKLVCSLDETAYRFFRHTAFFPSKFKKPRIYRSYCNKDLLSDANIVDICKPCRSTTNVQRDMLKGLEIFLNK